MNGRRPIYTIRGAVAVARDLGYHRKVVLIVAKSSGKVINTAVEGKDLWGEFDFCPCPLVLYRTAVLRKLDRIDCEGFKKATGMPVRQQLANKA